MPPLSKATAPRDTSDLIPIPANQFARPLPPLRQSADPEFDPLALAPIPSVLGTDTDAARQFYRQGVSQVRMMPLPASSSIAHGAQIQSAVAAAVQDAGPVFSVNNIPNPVQDTFNLTGSGVSYGPGPGQVQIASGGAGDGLTHGTTPWETDPSSVIMVDDFVSGNESSGSIGQLGWAKSGGGLVFQGSWGVPNSGSLILTTPISANGGVLLTPHDPNTGFGGSLAPTGFPITYNTGWDCSFIFRWPTMNFGSGGLNKLTKVRLYLGFAARSVASGTTRPAKFIGLRYDTDPGPALTLSQVTVSGATTTYTGTITNGALNAYVGSTFVVAGFTNSGNNVTITVTASTSTTLVCTTSTQVNETHAGTATGPKLSDTTYHFECVQNAADAINVQGSTFDTGISIDNNWHRFRMRSIVQGQILFSIDGGTETQISMSTDTFPSGTSVEVFGNASATGNTQVLNNGGVWYSAACWGTPGTLAGCTGGAAVLNGTYPVQDLTPTNTGGEAYLNSGVNSSTSQTSSSITLKWYNAFFPMILFGNDSESLLGQNLMQIDFFGFVYNPGFATDFAQTTDPTKARFYLGQT